MTVKPTRHPPSFISPNPSPSRNKSKESRSDKWGASASSTNVLKLGRGVALATGARRLNSVAGYKPRVDRSTMAQSVDTSDSPYPESDAAERLRKRFPITKTTDQVATDLNQRILDLELEVKQLRYINTNTTKDLEAKLAFAYQKLQRFEQQSPYRETFEIYNKEMRRAEKRVESLRNTFVETVNAHELAYNSLLQKGAVSRKDTLLLNETRALQRNSRKLTVDLKGHELELNALKAKEKAWAAEHRDLEELRKGMGRCQKDLAKSENAVQSHEVTIGGSEKALASLRQQYEALDAKNRENERLIVTLQGQVDRLALKLQAGKIADRLDQSATKAPRLSPDEVPGTAPRPELSPPAVDKAALVKTHSQIKQCRTQLTENIKIVREETGENSSANLCAATDSLERNVATVLKILGGLEMKELNYLNTISQLTGVSPLR